VLREAEKLAEAGVKELLVISQDTSSYGKDIGYAASDSRGAARAADIASLAAALGELGVWVRLHYIYPYPHVDRLIPLMAEGRVLPYLDIPFQHSHPDVLKRMARPAASAKTLDRIAAWRRDCPELALRSTFIVGYPGETEAEFAHLLDWLKEARLDRVGCFKYENVAGARANALPDHVPDAVKEERFARFMEAAQAISAEKMAARVGTRIEVLVDEVDGEGAVARSKMDAPEIDGQVFIDEDFEGLAPGDVVTVEVEEAAEYDLWARRL
jgi:ribosomal protein S12 methylthiotransferase